VRSETLDAVEGIVHALLLVEEDIATDLSRCELGTCTEMERYLIAVSMVTNSRTFIRVDARRVDMSASLTGQSTVGLLSILAPSTNPSGVVISMA
jgi:hypothetical protein